MIQSNDTLEENLNNLFEYLDLYFLWRSPMHRFRKNEMNKYRFVCGENIYNVWIVNGKNI